jgi:ATP-dependent DNA helicase RecG
MTLEELEDILQQSEGTTVEYKEALKGVPKALYETVISFSNTDGGTVVLGVDDNGKVLGVSPELVPQYLKEIVSTLNNPQACKPSIFLEPVAVAHPDGEVVVLRVPASSQLHQYKGSTYWRSNDNDQDVSKNQKKIEDIIFQKREHYSEGIIYPFLGYTDLDEQLFDKARQIISLQNSNHPWLLMTNQELLVSASLQRKDFKSGEEGLTLAAALIFGKDSTIHNLLPGYKVDALVRRNNLDRHDDRVLLRTNLIDTYTQLLSFVKKHLDDKFYQENGQRRDLRELIFREVVGNLIVHREYTNAYSSELVVYENKVTATNPSKALFHGPLDLKKFNPYPKNPNIRKFFTAFGWTDELGSGVRNTCKYLDIYVPGAKPSFIESDIFLTEIPLLLVSMQQYHRPLCQWLELSESAAELVKNNLASLSLDPSLHSVNWPALILHLVPGWNQKGTQLKALNWPKKQHLSQDEIEKVSGWDEKGTRLLHKKVNYFIKILFLSIAPIALTELMKYIDYSNRNAFRQNYLLPLQEVGYLQKTDESAVSSPEQKYVLTALGQQFLTGNHP